jgi:hypothetical protein
MVDGPSGAITTRADGTFTIERVPPSESPLWVTVPGQPGRAPRFVVMRENAVIDLGDVKMLPLATLRIAVCHPDGAPWRGTVPIVWAIGPAGAPLLWEPKFVDGALEGTLEPGAVQLKVDGTDLIATPRDLELLPGERRVVQFPVDIGRRVELVFAGDRDAKIDARDTLRLEVTDERGAVVVRDECRRSPHGDGNWSLDQTFAFGSYEVTARTDSDRRYRAKFVIDDARSMARRIEVPRLP